MAEGLLIGVDAGGTSTKALALDLKTGDQRTARADGANWTVHGPEVCAERLSAAVTEAAAGRPIRSLAVCIAGFYPPDHAEAANAWASGRWPEVPHLTIQPDVHAAWAGAFGGEPGIVVISGTGSIAYGRNAAGQEARAGGWGPLFDDRGSAFHLGQIVLQSMAHQVDLDSKPTFKPYPFPRLYSQVMERWPELGSDPRSWLRGVYRASWGREEVAAVGGEYARLFDGANEYPSDQHPLDGLISDVGIALVRLAALVNRILGVSCVMWDDENPPVPVRVALQGGLGEHSRALREQFQFLAARYAEKKCADYVLELVPSMFSAVVGAVVLATPPEERQAVQERLRV